MHNLWWISSMFDWISLLTIIYLVIVPWNPIEFCSDPRFHGIPWNFFHTPAFHGIPWNFEFFWKKKSMEIHRIPWNFFEVLWNSMDKFDKKKWIIFLNIAVFYFTSDDVLFGQKYFIFGWYQYHNPYSGHPSVSEYGKLLCLHFFYKSCNIFLEKDVILIWNTNLANKAKLYKYLIGINYGIVWCKSSSSLSRIRIIMSNIST